MVTTVDVEIPRNRLMAEGYIDDEYLLNQMAGINDNPSEDGLPLRKYLLREAHDAIEKDPKLTEVILKAKSDKTSRTQFRFVCPPEEE